ncbi:MAG TPA: ferredoxin [Treponema sp.]|nr:MAG: ferredoxin [Treponema sp. GWA1_62_8]OHE66560.1 MAG: ferredoxin [Treponema sp. GWC1_61_84]HCM27816.1 ferredoxin [Treponema sp.]
MEKQVTLKIDGREVTVREGSNLVDACAAAGIKVPTLCLLPEVAANASCGVCVVEVAGARSLARACVQKAAEGMVVSTSSERAASARRTAVELMLANHPDDCLSCTRNGTCELQALAELMGVRRRRFPRTRKLREAADRIDATSAMLERDEDKCVLCGRCVAVCRDVQTVSAIDFVGRGSHSRVAPFMDRGIESSVCVGCGQCTLVCPTGALTEKDETEKVFSLLRDPLRTVVVQTAPAIRASLGEALGMPTGALVTGKMVAALRRLGFDRVFDTQFTADLTIMEEGSELLERIAEKGTLPLITSCSPAWIGFIETFYPSLLPHLSSCKSPQQMFGAVAKTWWAKKAGIDPATLSVISIMPCTAKKRETKRPGMASSGFADVDYALTTRELARMIRRAGIDFARLEEEAFDDPLGASTGAATIFGTTGGVMEAALRTAYEIALGKSLPSLELEAVRGMAGVKEATIDFGGTPIRVAVAHGLGNARKVLDGMAAGNSPYAFVEVMSCPGGCIGGGGQPLLTDAADRKTRQEAVYKEDRLLPLRKSHENPAVATLYKEFLIKPLGERSKELLHTEYAARKV